MTTARRAFTLLDLTSTLVTALIIAAILALAAGESRRSAQLGEDIANLKRFAVATDAYTADNDNRIWGYTWEPGETYLMMNEDGDLVPTQMPHHQPGPRAYQATHLIRLLDNRVGDNNAMPLVNLWVPDIAYAHLPLVHYLEASPLSSWLVSSGDRVKQNWKDDPVNKFDEGYWLPLQPHPIESNRRTPYTSSYQASIATWDYNQSELDDMYNGSRIRQGSAYSSYLIPAGARFETRTTDDVAYPSSKVLLNDTHQRHFGPKEHYIGAVATESTDSGDAPARIPLLFGDGSASVRASGDANPGWVPNDPAQACDSYFYTPPAWEPPPTNGEDSQLTFGLYRWTRGGLKGVDFGGRPLDTGQATPGDCEL